MENNATKTVMEIGRLNLRGTLIDDGWFTHITHENGKPNLPAILILSEIIYWYRPTEVKDESTGLLLGFKKKFHSDKLQKYYQSLADRFGLTKRQSQEACIFLKKLGLITIEQRNVTGNNGRLIPNVTFIEPVSENIKKISCLYEENYKTLEPLKNQDNVTYITLECDIPNITMGDNPNYNVPYPPVECDTNTYTTTKNTIKNSSINLDGMDGNSKRQNVISYQPIDYKSIILQNIEYDLLKEDYPNESLIDDIVEIMVEVVNSKKGSIKVNSEDKPGDVVKSVFLKLNKSHIEYVVESLNGNTVKTKNIKSYIITVLYNAPMTMNAYYMNRVNSEN